ncbi:MAG: glycosyltransferase family 2 protein [Planctomycetes bacterium]|nr:glycosyltransferase family 2 protein [Planctomycetota bacterium]
MSADRSHILLAIPVYNEAKSIERVLRDVSIFARDVLVIDDGSKDGTPQLLAKHQVEVIRHAENRGYGRSMQDILRWADFDGYQWVITMDCDEQHEPAEIPSFVRAIERNDADIISGSRYLIERIEDDDAPEDRFRVNRIVTEEVNSALRLNLTDAFCGFKAYRTEAMKQMRLGVDGYDFPMQFWAQAAFLNLRIREIPVRRIYKDMRRTFGNGLDCPETRLRLYRNTLRVAMAEAPRLLQSAAMPDPIAE